MKTSTMLVTAAAIAFGGGAALAQTATPSATPSGTTPATPSTGATPAEPADPAADTAATPATPANAATAATPGNDQAATKDAKKAQ